MFWFQVYKYGKEWIDLQGTVHFLCTDLLEKLWTSIEFHFIFLGIELTTGTKTSLGFAEAFVV